MVQRHRRPGESADDVLESVWRRVIVVEDSPEFEMGQRVKVREAHQRRSTKSRPELRLLGKEGAIALVAQVEPFFAYIVEFENGERVRISPEWLEEAG